MEGYHLDRWTRKLLGRKAKAINGSGNSEEHLGGVVLANPKISGPGLSKPIKAQSGVSVEPQVSQRLKRRITEDRDVGSV